MIYRWHIEIWMPDLKDWSLMATAISEELAEEIVASFEENDLYVDGYAESYSIVPQPTDYGI